VAVGVAHGERRLGVIDFQLGLLEFHGSVAKERRIIRKWERGERELRVFSIIIIYWVAL
jgi:hypothetical protein